MTVHCMSNPRAFVKDAKKAGVSYELLREAILCIGEQATSRMFVGKCKRGGGVCLSAANMKNWILTFEYNISHPDEEDKDPYQSRSITPYPTWHEYIKLIRSPISEDEMLSWKNMSNNKLGDEAIKWGITFGVRNANALKSLLSRMEKMYTRRKELFWDVHEEPDEKEEKVDYRMMNVPKLHELCKKRGIVSAHTKKEDMIKLLENYNPEQKVISLDYNEMTSIQLKNIAKEKGLNQYNNLNHRELVQRLLDIDKEERTMTEDDSKLVLHGITIIARKEDKYIDVTRFLQASNTGKLFANWYELKRSKNFLNKLSSVIGIPITELTNVIQGGTYQGTWVHPRVAINIAQWVSPEFDVAVSGWIYQLLSEGSVRLQRPVKCLTDLTEIDIEAEKLEMEIDWSTFTNKCILYMAYIGNGLVKIGYSDGKFLERDLKHQSSGSEYPQWRMVKLYQISGKPIEKLIHDLIFKYKANFNKQKEIFKPPTTLNNFIETIKQLLFDNDLKLRVQLLEKENLELKLKLAEMTK